MKRTVSVVIATYNSEAVIKRALDSVLKQKDITFECIVVDGMSTDLTVNILQSYGKQIRYISEKDNGIFDALNKGVKMSRYDWIYILGSDDELISSTSLAELLSGDDIDDKEIVYGNVVVRYPNGTLIQNYSKDYSLVRICMFACHQGIIMRKSVILELNGFNQKYKLCADFDLIQRAYLRGYKFKQTQVNVAYYSSDGASSVMSFSVLKKNIYSVLRDNRSVKYPYVCFLCFYVYMQLRKYRDLIKRKR